MIISIRYILTITILLLFACEEPTKNVDNENAEIKIISPMDGTIFTTSPIDIIVTMDSYKLTDVGNIYINGNLIASGLTDTMTVSYEPPSNSTQEILIEATLQNSSDEILISIEDIETFTSEIIFVDCEGYSEDDFKLMRHPVTNREFITFLNHYDGLIINTTEISWSDNDSDGYGNPELCEFDPGDDYDPIELWYVNVTTHFANEIIEAGEYTVYKNADNIYEPDANWSEQGGRIQYDCLGDYFYLDNEQFLDHPVVGVSWIGANIFANFFGWSLPTMEQWKYAARADNTWLYPWGNYIDQNAANYDNNETTIVGYYNGLGELNMSLSAMGAYDMGGNVWEFTSSTSLADIYYKTGGAFGSVDTLLQIGYQAFTEPPWNVTNDTGFRCVTDINYPTSPIPGCTEIDACNHDSFANNLTECFIDDCLGICGGTAEEYEFYQDNDGDGLGSDISEMQCNDPQDGWVDNSDDVDDECYSENNNQDNIDCNGTCNGDAYTDGCGDCVGGDTGNGPCAEDCNGVDGGTADWDQCGICAGGDTDLEPDEGLDCNGVCAPSTPQGEIDLENGLEYGAYIDDCGYCVGGGTGLEENYADLGCGCNQPAADYYCEDENGNGNCDCNDNGLNWGDNHNCNVEIDAYFLCEDETLDYYINVILGCSWEDAENYYCNQEDNECVPFGTAIIPPGNFIDDGSCIILGCTDPMADNYYEDATECEDGSPDNCCIYTEPLQVSFGNVDNGTMEVYIIIPEYDDDSGYVYGFQFYIEGVNLSGASGGLAADNGFDVSVSENMVLGFSFSGTFIGQGEGVLTNLTFTQNDGVEEACFTLDVNHDGIDEGAFSNQNSVPIPVIFGDCYEF